VLTATRYDVDADVTYATASGRELKLDVYWRENAKSPTPVVMFIHGGGWVRGDKARAVPSLLPYLEMGWVVVNVNYRLAGVAPAPAAVEDCRCALHWIGRNAKKYLIDTSKVVVSGESAGAHLALMTGMVPSSAGFDDPCVAQDDPKWAGPWPDPTPKVAAIVNLAGISDLGDVVQGPNARSWAISWFAGQPGRNDLVRRVSPINYVRAGVPAVVTLHGDADPIAPFSQAVRLHEALSKARVPNRLVSIPSATHGDFTEDQFLGAYAEIWDFLAKNGLGRAQ
jgi:acetyl esterase/lipase